MSCLFCPISRLATRGCEPPSSVLSVLSLSDKRLTDGIHFGAAQSCGLLSRVMQVGTGGRHHKYYLSDELFGCTSGPEDGRRWKVTDGWESRRRDLSREIHQQNGMEFFHLQLRHDGEYVMYLLCSGAPVSVSMFLLLFSPGLLLVSMPFWPCRPGQASRAQAGPVLPLVPASMCD